MSYGPTQGQQPSFQNPWSGYGDFPAPTGDYFQAPDVSRVYVGPPELAPKPRPKHPQPQSSMTSYGSQPSELVQPLQNYQHNQRNPTGTFNQPGQLGNNVPSRRSTFIPDASPTDRDSSYLPYLQPESPGSPRSPMTPGTPGSTASDPRRMPSRSSSTQIPPVPPLPSGPPPPMPIPIPAPAPAVMPAPTPVRTQTVMTMASLHSSQSTHSLQSTSSLQSSQEQASGRKPRKSKSGRLGRPRDPESATPLPPVPPGHRVNYHAQALDIVGAHPSSPDHIYHHEQQQPAPYPVMMKPSFTNAERASMPVEAVMARYGQALPGDPATPPLSRNNTNVNANGMAGIGAGVGSGMNMGMRTRPGMMMDERETAAVGATNDRYESPSSLVRHQQEEQEIGQQQMQHSYQNIGRTPGLTPTQNLTRNLNQNQYRNSLPEPLYPIPREAPVMPPHAPNPSNSLHPQPTLKKHNRLSRPSSRRTQSEAVPPPQLKPSSSAQDLNLNPIQNHYPGQLNQPPSPAEENKKTSLVKKLTKKRPNSASNVDKRGQVQENKSAGRPEEPFQVPFILPDVLFHVRAVQDYEMQSYEELSFPAGTIIAVTSAPENGRWTGWRIDKPETRKSPGVFYRTYVSLLQRVDSSRANGSTLFQVQAVCTYYATRPDEFDFSAGDIINVQSTPLGQFWVGFLASEDPYLNNRGKLFPWKLVVPN